MPGVGEHTAFATVFEGDVFDGAVPIQHPVEQPTVPVVPYEIEEHRCELDDVPITVEDRVVQFLADACRS